MKLDFNAHEKAIAGRLEDFRQAVSDLRQRLTRAEGIVRTFSAGPTKAGVTHALTGHAEAATIAAMLAPLEDDAGRIETGLRDAYIAGHADELARICEAFVTERTKTREAYRKTRGAKVAAIVERLTIDDSLSPADRTRIDNEAMVLENELLGAEQALAAARRAIEDLKREPSFANFVNARDISANVSFV
ncbi:MAG: hypothetical protein DVB27_03105 [Verrucomicrobia bacterium]|nr:MAG: hypothetical protein DVB27_03105 [Verrucomicrobiota bacterium]